MSSEFVKTCQKGTWIERMNIVEICQKARAFIAYFVVTGFLLDVADILKPFSLMHTRKVLKTTWTEEWSQTFKKKN